MDLLVSDESPAQVSDKIKDILYSKSAEKIKDVRPDVASSLFDDGEVEDSEETTDETDTEVEANADTEVEDQPAEPTAKLFYINYSIKVTL